MQIPLALSVLRCREADPDTADRILRGHLEEAAHIGLRRLWRIPTDMEDRQRSLLVQMVARTLLALGREQEAQEMLQDVRKLYGRVSRQWLRWCSSLDQGWTFLCLNRPGRAIECFRSIVDDAAAPPDLMVEAMNCQADALQLLGECRRGATLVTASAAVCEEQGWLQLAQVVECHRLELAAVQLARRSDELSDHALATSFRERAGTMPAPVALRRQLAEQERSVGDMVLVAHRLQHLQLLITSACGASDISDAGRLIECLSWLKDRRLAGLESNARIESAMALMAGGASNAAFDMLSTLAHNESQVRQSRYSMDLQYCRSKLLQTQGRIGDSLAAYKQHVEQAFYVLKRDFNQAVLANPAETDAEGGDAVRLRLPLRYRGAYQFILEHLSDTNLSVRHVAAHAGVTERSLQLAFRAHLGLTPAEFIRRRRMERIRSELQTTSATGSRVSILDVAGRWGVNNRSTLAQNYRELFAETPFETLHGKSGGNGSKP
ncbi:helix-turn-helix domain-containing protein [Roseateles sp. SL47]|uniref:helix-turn-helix domain-containing protein n=1 Tax=Roseateles sp. SL47 TaxID=2995138 RepID=UPI00226F5154|nr:helix-turn-helix domain-containing protein [Roseateles sp. SL47]WAC71600.1 helix-turn-helix domain-containing protein [Roseateles sp. SL47]